MMLPFKNVILFVSLMLQASIAEAFVPMASRSSRSVTTTLSLKIPSFGTDDNKKEEGSGEEKKLGLSGFVQLFTAGLGAPFLGDYEGYDKESNSFMFSLEANNFVDEKGNSKQTQMPYFEEGWVDPADLEKERRQKEEGFKFPWQK